MTARSHVDGALPVLAAAVLWGTVGPAQVLADSTAPPAALGAVRLLLGGAVLLAVLPLLRRRSPAGPGASELWRRPAVGWLALAAVSTGVFQAAFLTSVTRTGAALATVVALGVAPPAAGLVSWLATGERLTPVWAAGTGAAVGGTALVLLPGGTAGVDPLGIGLGVVAGTCYGLYTVAAKVLLDGRAPVFVAIAVTLLGGGLVLSPALVVDPGALADPDTLALVVWLAVPATALAYVLFVRGLARISAGAAGTLSLAEPLVAAALGFTLLGERLPPSAAVGVVLLLAGLVAVAGPRRAPVRPGAAPAPRGSGVGSLSAP
jgi:DME family drug/metabolite transporter